MTFAEALKKEDFESLVDRLAAYAAMRISGVDVKKRGGTQPIDLVADVLRKASDGTRKWNPDKVSLRGFLFGAVRSEISDYLRKVKGIKLTAHLTDFLEDHPCETPEERADAIEKLRCNGGDENEVKIFECWADGITKPSEVAEELQIHVDDVYKISKRLTRRLAKI